MSKKFFYALPKIVLGTVILLTGVKTQVIATTKPVCKDVQQECKRRIEDRNRECTGTWGWAKNECNWDNKRNYACGAFGKTEDASNNKGITICQKQWAQGSSEDTICNEGCKGMWEAGFCTGECKH